MNIPFRVNNNLQSFIKEVISLKVVIRALFKPQVPQLTSKKLLSTLEIHRVGS